MFVILKSVITLKLSEFLLVVAIIFILFVRLGRKHIDSISERIPRLLLLSLVNLVQI